MDGVEDALIIQLDPKNPTRIPLHLANTPSDAPSQPQ